MPPRVRRAAWRPAWPVWLAVGFIVVPIAELYILSRVGDHLGWPATLALLLSVSVAGAWLVKREGQAAWRSLRQAFGQARLPTAEVVDGALVLVGGTLLLTPGFLTDIVGLALVVPPSRTVVNRLLRRRARGAVISGVSGTARPSGRHGASRASRASRSNRALRSDVLDVEVVDIERSPRGDERR